MTLLEFKNIQKKTDSKLYRWVIDTFGCWDYFVDNYLYNGSEFFMPINCVTPRSFQEWTEAKHGASYTNDIIEIEMKGVDMIVIHDGHNRLKTFLNDGIENIKVRFVS